MILNSVLIPLFPLIGFLINGLGRKYLPKPLVGLIGSLSVFLSFVFSLMLFFELKDASVKSYVLPLFDWINTAGLNISFSFLIDPLSSLFLLIITGVGLLIHIYSIGYMKEDEGFAKFFAYLNLFVFFMLILVMGANFPVLFIGWEGVGLCSYLLIGFWFKNIDYTKAAKKAFVMNRIGDLGFLLGMYLIFQTFGSLDYSSVFAATQTATGIPSSTYLWITLLLFIGAVGKSAQIPLYTWLPDAMAGPTPVSALIHAATMVTAGIYMIARSNILFAMAPFTLEIITYIGAITALFAALIAMTQNDIKKVLAYSTVSQLGYMFVALGVGSFSSGIFHVMTHAFFKALLFLGAGSVIHAMHNEQDIRNMGGLKSKLPITFITMFIGTLAISGLPPFAGFFSKDEIFAVVYPHSPIAFYILAITSVLTCLYMFRMFFLTFYGDFRGTVEQKKHLHESPISITFPLIILAIFSAIAGFAGMPEIFSKTHFLNEFLKPIFEGSKNLLIHTEISHSTEYKIMGASLLAIIISGIYSYFKFTKSTLTFKEDYDLNFLEKLSYNKFYVDEFYHLLITKPLSWISKVLYNFVDVLGIDGIVNQIGKVVIISGKNVRLMQTGNVGFYILAMVIGICMVLFFGFFIN